MLDRKTPPPFVKSTSFDLIDPATISLNNESQIFVIPGGSQDVLKVELVFSAGKWFEKRNGAAQFTTNLLTKGTTTRSSFEIAQIFDSYGAHVEVHPGLDFVSVAVYTLTQYCKPVLELFYEVLTQPAFSDKELRQHQTVVIQNIKVNEEKTSYLASKAFRKKLFGAEHPYGREIESADVENLSSVDLARHFSESFKSPLIFLSGKISDENVSLAKGLFSKLASGKIMGAVFQTNGVHAFNEKLEKEGSVQASIRMGKKSLMRNHADYALAVFVNHLLGGYFGSRLMKNIREEKGLTYGIYSSLQPLQHDSFLVIGADVNKENIDLTIGEIQKELRTLRTEPISASELETAKNHFIGSLQSEISTPFAHADKIKTIRLSNLPKNYYQQMITAINAVDAGAVMRISEAHFNEDSFSSVAVG